MEKVEERNEADHDRVEEEREKKCNRFSYAHLYRMHRDGFQALRNRQGCWLGNSEN